MKRLIILLLIFCFAAGSYAAQDLNIRETDGSPSVNNVRRIKVTNGTLTDNGNSIVSLSTGGIPGGSNTQFQFNDSGSFGGNGALTFTKGSKTLAIPADAPLDINSTSVSIADTDITLDGASTTFTQTTGAITMVPANGSNMAVRLDGVSDFAVDGTKLFVNNNGDVGIGTAAPGIANPAANQRILTIKHPLAGGAVEFYNSNDSAAANTALGAYRFYAGSNKRLVGRMNAAALDTTENASVMTFQTKTNGTALAEGLRVYGDRQVAIGAPYAPTNKFVINGDAATATYQQFTIGGTTGKTSTDGSLIGLDSSGNFNINQQEKLKTVFVNNGTTTMSLTKDNRVAIGNSGPNAGQKFQVNGFTLIANNESSSSNGLTLTNVGGTGRGGAVTFQHTGFGTFTNKISGSSDNAGAGRVSTIMNIQNTNNGSSGATPVTIFQVFGDRASLNKPGTNAASKPTVFFTVNGSSASTPIALFRTNLNGQTADLTQWTKTGRTLAVVDNGGRMALGKPAVTAGVRLDVNGNTQINNGEFRVAGSRLVANGGNLVGIGLTNPLNKINVNGNAATAVYEQFTEGGTTGVTSSDGTLIGLDSSGNFNVNQQEKLSTIFTNNGSEGFRITKDRFLGARLTNPRTLLTLNGDAATTFNAIQFTIGGTTGITGGDGSLIQLNSSGQLNINNQENAVTIFTNNNRQVMRLTPGGLVGINNNNPVYTLDMISNGNSGIKVVGSTAQALWMQRSIASTASPNAYFVKSRGTYLSPAIPSNGDNLGLFIFSPFNGASSQQEPAIFGARLSGTVTGASMPADIYFSAGTSTTNRPERLTIKSSGNVGVGFVNPDQKLDVNGTLETIAFRMPTSPSAGYVLTSDAGGNGTWAAASGGANGSLNIVKLRSTSAFTNGDLIQSVNGTMTKVPIGTNGQVLTVINNAKKVGYTTVAGTGDVVGPSASVINGIALFSVTTGKEIKYNRSVPLITRHQQSLYIGNGAGANANGTTTANTAFGFGTLTGGTSFTGDNNTAMGYEAGRVITTGSSNAVFGFQAGEGITTGTQNTVMGLNALQTANQLNLTGSNNTCIGYRGCFNLHSVANGNTVLGSNIIFGSTSTASRNILLGFQAGDAITTGSNNIVIGYDIDAPSNTGQNRMTIGNLIYGNGMTATGTTVSTGKVGIAKPLPTETLDINGSLAIKKTITASTSNGDTTINNAIGSVNFKTGASSLKVTNSLVTTNSVIIATVASQDITMHSVRATALSGAFNLDTLTAPTALTRVNFMVIN